VNYAGSDLFASESAPANLPNVIDTHVMQSRCAEA